MKKLNTISILLLFLLLGCSVPMGHLSIVSTREVDMGAYYVKIADNIQGQAITHIIIFFPTKLIVSQ